MRSVKRYTKAKCKRGLGELMNQPPPANPSPGDPPSDMDRLRAAIAELEAERQLMRQSLEYHERDRQLLAFEIHDGIIQDMTAALMFLEAAGGKAKFADDDARGHFERGVRLLRDSVDEARRLIQGLIPIVLDERGLVATLQGLAHKLRVDHAMEIDYATDVNQLDLAPAIEMILVRIVQEALNNVWKHSKTLKAEVRLRQEKDVLELSVRDWGAGFEPALVSKSRYGLTGIRERARLIGGEATITSQPGRGTQVLVRLNITDKLHPPSGDDSAERTASGQ